MKKFALSLALLSSASGAFAAEVTSLKCEQDQRPVDGNYTSVELVKNDAGKYDVFYHVITAGFGAPVKERRVKIAQNLQPCTFAQVDPRIASCLKYEREEGEKTNTGFTAKKVVESQVHEGSGQLLTTESIAIRVYSPQLASGTPKEGYPYMERPGIYEARFQAAGRGGVMLNRCAVK